MITFFEGVIKKKNPLIADIYKDKVLIIQFLFILNPQPQVNIASS